MEKTYDLGMKGPCCMDPESKDGKVYYPSLYLSDLDETPELPLGKDVEVKAVMRLVKHTETETEDEDGEEETMSCTIEVRSITVDTKLNMVDHAIGTSLQEELMKMLKKKYPDMEVEDEGDDEEDY